MLFKDLGLNEDVVKALDELGYTIPTQIQQEVIPLILDGKNVVGQSQTGTGKTASFVLPLVQNVDNKSRDIQVLIVAPTRELVTQTREEVYKLTKFLRLRSLAVYGGSKIFHQKKDLERKPQIIAGTPGRLIDFIESGVIDLSKVKYFVLDEVDRMLDMGFVEDIEFIWSKLPSDAKVMTFSATLDQSILGIIKKHIGDDYSFVKVGDAVTVDKINHCYMDVDNDEKFNLLKRLLYKDKGTKVIIFSQTKRNTQILATKLNKDGFEAGYLHGDMTQRERFKTLNRYKAGELKVLITTDVAARGLNMDNVELVINYEVPTDPESYIHRIGRTGRAGADGKAIMMVSPNEFRLLKVIEKVNKTVVKRVDEDMNELERKDLKKRDNDGEKDYGRATRNFRSGKGFAGRGRPSARRGDQRSSGRFSDRGDRGERGTGERKERSYSRFSDKSERGSGERKERSYSRFSDKSERGSGERKERSYSRFSDKPERGTGERKERSYSRFSDRGERGTGERKERSYSRFSDRGERGTGERKERSYSRFSDKSERGTGERKERSYSRFSDKPERGSGERKERSYSRFSDKPERGSGERKERSYSKFSDKGETRGRGRPRTNSDRSTSKYFDSDSKKSAKKAPTRIYK